MVQHGSEADLGQFILVGAKGSCIRWFLVGTKSSFSQSRRPGTGGHDRGQPQVGSRLDEVQQLRCRR